MITVRARLIFATVSFMHKACHIRIYELLMFLSLIFPGRQDWKAKYLKWRQERSNLNPSWSNCDIKMPVKKSGHQVILFQEKTAELGFWKWWNPRWKIEIKYWGKIILCQNYWLVSPCCLVMFAMGGFCWEVPTNPICSIRVIIFYVI